MVEKEKSHCCRWFTCTPKRFQGNPRFFARDSGLLCKGFQELGVECRAILPGPPMDDDQNEDLIRTDFSNLEDEAWWRSLEGEGVVFYGWGDGKYAKIAQAIKQSGMVLVSHMDTGGLIGILNGPLAFGAGVWRVARVEHPTFLLASFHFLKRYLSAMTVGLYFNEYRRGRHLKEADMIGAITPIALNRIKKICRYYRAGVAERVMLIPHPISKYMAYDQAVPKEEVVIAVGRWNDELVKGTNLLAETITQFFSSEHSARVEIYGLPSELLTQWYENLPSKDRKRVTLKGQTPNRELRHAFQRASVCVCTSVRESFHIASAEALCSGASVVGPDVEELPGLKWFTEAGCGTLAPRTAEGLAAGLVTEFSAWRQGLRQPQAISDQWTEITHAPKVAQQILNCVDFKNS